MRFDWNFTSLPAVAGPQRLPPHPTRSPLPHFPFPYSPCQPACWHIYVFNKQHDRLKMSARRSTVDCHSKCNNCQPQDTRGRQGDCGEWLQCAQWAQDALDYLTFCMAHRIMNEINLISAINALVVSKFRLRFVPPSQSTCVFMFIIIDS